MENDLKTEQDELKPTEITGFGRVEDSRLKGYFKRVSHPTLPLIRTYCCKCGREYGWVSEESYEYIAAGEIVVFCEECEKDINKIGGGVPLPVAGDQNTKVLQSPPQIKTNAIAGDLPLRRGVS